MSDNVLAGWSVLTEWPRLRLGHSVRTDRQLVHYPIQDAPLIHVLRKLKVWPLRGRYVMSYSFLTLFFSLNLSCCSLHSFCSTQCLLQTDLSYKAVLTFNGVVCRTLRVTPQELAPCLSVNGERLHFLEQGSKNLFSNTRQGGSKRKVLVANVAV